MSVDTDKEEKQTNQEPLRLGLNRQAIYRKTVDVRWILLAAAGIFAVFSFAFQVPLWASFFCLCAHLCVGHRWRRQKPHQSQGTQRCQSQGSQPDRRPWHEVRRQRPAGPVLRGGLPRHNPIREQRRTTPLWHHCCGRSALLPHPRTVCWKRWTASPTGGQRKS